MQSALRAGSRCWLTLAGAVWIGPTSLLLRIFWGHSSVARYVAAVCFVIGALISRYAWIAAGRVSSRDPQALFRIQRPAPNSTAPVSFFPIPTNTPPADQNTYSGHPE